MEEKKLTGYPSIDKPWLKYYPEEAVNTPLPECTIYEYIWNKNKDHLDKLALKYFGKGTTYAQLFSRIDNVAKAFSALGVKQGELVSLCMLTMPETVYSIYGLNKLGAVCNMIEPRTNAELIKDRINAANSRVLVVVDVFLSKILQIADKTKLQKIIVVPLAQSMPIYTKIGFKLTKGRKIPNVPSDKRYQYWGPFLTKGRNESPKFVPYVKNAPAAIIYTGGTTGISKGALLSNDSMTAMAVQTIYGAPRLYEGERFLEIMPPFIAYGLVFGFFIPFCASLENTLIPVFEPKKFAGLVLKHKPNHVVGVPAFFESLANSAEVGDHKLDFLMCAITGGDRLLANTEDHINQFFKDHGCKYSIMKGYGMTEMGSAATFTVTDDCNIPGSVGVPTHLAEVKVIDHETGAELGYNAQGELCMTGSTMMLRYYQNDSETSKVMRKHPDGKVWIHTGDIGYMTEDGVIYIVDRIKRMVIRPDGHNVWPSQIEEVVTQHPAIKDCAVVGMPNPENRNGKIPTAFMVVDDRYEASDALIEEIDRFSKVHLPERDVAMAYRFVDKLPLTLVGKVDYRALEKEAEKL
ncbi:MAG: acyl--CoA ligase [Ruminococcaceae bacterium]|nr:acyl--CoA ligase [Oscillospiraceae bacterium]